MLYANEEVEAGVYDPETGEPIQLEQPLVESDELAERIRIAGEVERMATSEGWKEISDWLRKMEKDLSGQLLQAGDLDKVRRLQEAVKVYRSVQTYVQHRIFEGKHLQELRDQDPRDMWG